MRGIDRFVAAHPIFDYVPPGEFGRVVGRFAVTRFPAGARIVCGGEQATVIYLVLQGRVALIEGHDLDAALLAELVEGDMLGELASMTGAVHGSTAIATEPTVLAAIDKADLRELICDYPEILNYLAGISISRARAQCSARQAPAYRKVAIFSDPAGPCPEQFARTLADSLALYSIHTAVRPLVAGAPGSAIGRLVADCAHCELVFARIEETTDLNRLSGVADTAIALAGDDASAGRAAEALEQVGGKTGLVCCLSEWIGKGAARRPAGPATYPSFALREGCKGDIDRVVRHILGKSIGLVLSGGGARCAAHIGVLRAAADVGLSFDYIVATSFSAPIGAMAALEWKSSEISRTVSELYCRRFHASKSMPDWLSRRFPCPVSKGLHHAFGSARIEDTPISFGCLSVELCSGREAFHDSGPLWQALRASLAVPGLLPPGVIDGKYHADGAVLNNFPIGTLQRLLGAGRCGLVVGVDVSRCSAPEFSVGGRNASALRRIWRSSASRNAESYRLLADAAVLLRATSLEKYGRHSAVDCLIEPNLSSFPVGEWSRQLELEERGYWAAIPALTKLCQRLHQPGSSLVA